MGVVTQCSNRLPSVPRVLKAFGGGTILLKAYRCGHRLLIKPMGWSYVTESLQGDL